MPWGCADGRCVAAGSRLRVMREYRPVSGRCHGCVCFFFQAEDGIRDLTVTGVQTCALPILNVLTLLLYGALGAVTFLLPFDLIQVQGYSPARAGAALLPFVATMSILSRYADRKSVV